MQRKACASFTIGAERPKSVWSHMQCVETSTSLSGRGASQDKNDATRTAVPASSS